MKLPAALKHTTLDEAAECLTVKSETRRKLWSLVPKDDEVPRGRRWEQWCGSEWPEPDSPDRRARSLELFWSRLTEDEQRDIVRAAVEEGWT